MRTYKPEDLKRELGSEDVSVIDPTAEVPTGSFKSAKMKWRKELPSNLSRLLFSQSPNGATDRSELLYKMGGKLIERGVPYNEAWHLLYGSPMGQSKYGDRPEEVHRILSKHEPPRRKKRRGHTDTDWEDLYSLLGKSIPQPKWLIDNVWGLGSFGMMAGQAKVHKTWLSLDLAISVSSGKPFLDKFPVRDVGPVMVIEAEVRRHSMRYRSMLIANQKGLHPQVKGDSIVVPQVSPLLLRRDTHMDLTDPENLDKLERKIDKVQPKLIILDPLQFMIGEADENSARDVRPVLIALSELSLTYGVAVVLVHHYRKNYEQGMRAGQRAAGSQAFHAWGESNLWIEYVADNAIKVQREYRDFDSPGDMEVIFDIRGDTYEPWVTEYDPNFAHKDDSRKKQTGEALYAIVEAHPGMTIPELSKQIGKAQKTLRRIVNEDPSLKFKAVPAGGNTGGAPRKGIYLQ